MKMRYISPVIECHYSFQVEGCIMGSTQNTNVNTSSGQDIGGEYNGGGDGFSHDWE